MISNDKTLVRDPIKVPEGKLHYSIYLTRLRKIDFFTKLSRSSFSAIHNGRYEVGIMGRPINNLHAFL